jgi:hypothetical protein
MECMRALAANDRHIDGCWTGYSPSLERSILKKVKYLEDGAPSPESAPPSTPAEPAAPQSQPLPAPEHQQQRFTPTSSPFAEKLQQAWRKDP